MTEHDEPFWGEPRTGDFQKVDNAASAPLGVHCSESVGGITLTSMHSDAQKKRNFLSSNSQIAIARRRWSTCDAGRMRLPQRSSIPCASAKHGSEKALGSGPLRRYSPSKFGDRERGIENEGPGLTSRSPAIILSPPLITSYFSTIGVCVQSLS